MKEILKITYHEAANDNVENNSWEYQKHSNYTRIAISPKNNFINHILNIIKKTEPPYMILYVLSIPRIEEEGRYQIENPLSFQELEEILLINQDFFERDSRHDLWIGSLNGGELLVYDKHNILYAYNSDELVKKYLEENLFVEEELIIPFPHTHYYHIKFDQKESDLIADYKWIRFELKEQDRH